jgi:hypothetical protein
MKKSRRGEQFAEEKCVRNVKLNLVKMVWSPDRARSTPRTISLDETRRPLRDTRRPAGDSHFSVAFESIAFRSECRAARAVAADPRGVEAFAARAPQDERAVRACGLPDSAPFSFAIQAQWCEARVLFAARSDLSLSPKRRFFPASRILLPRAAKPA